MIDKSTVWVAGAPMQGYTEAPWRHFHAFMFGGVDWYMSPFVRLERGEPSRRAMRDILSPLNANHRLIPQIIFRNVDEWNRLTEAVVSAGFGAINLNMGCPFPPQVKHGRGAATVADGPLLEMIGRRMEAFPEMKFSVKMRLGVTSPDEWRRTVDALNAMPLDFVAVHPRVAVQQYSGDLALEEFGQICSELQHPVVFNGDLLSAEDIDNRLEQYPQVKGVMLGRGLLARPSIAAEWRSGEAVSDDDLRRKIVGLHDSILDHYRNTLEGGDNQVLMKIRPFWDYAGAMFDRRELKAIAKASSLRRYVEAVNAL